MSLYSCTLLPVFAFLELLLILYLFLIKVSNNLTQGSEYIMCTIYMITHTHADTLGNTRVHYCSSTYVYQTQNVYHTQDVYQTQNVYYTQDVYQTPSTLTLAAHSLHSFWVMQVPAASASWDWRGLPRTSSHRSLDSWLKLLGSMTSWLP